jgi:hypothetical protein
MPRLLNCTVGWLLVTAVHVTAQQPGAVSTRSIFAGGPSAQVSRPKLLPGTPSNVFSAIQGNALNSANAALGNAPVRLRDARAGHIVESQLTDRTGLFSFKGVDPGSYIVEIMGQDQYSVLAATGVLNVGPGEAVSAVVKLPYYNLPTIGSFIGRSTPTAGAVTSQAAASGVTASQATGAATCDTPQ